MAYRAPSPPPNPGRSQTAPRVHSPHPETLYRPQTPTAPLAIRAHTPPAPQRHRRSQSQPLDAGSRAGTSRSATSGTRSPPPHARRPENGHGHGTAPATPVPPPASPSPTNTARSHPQRVRAEAARRGRARARKERAGPKVPFEEHAMPTGDQLVRAAGAVVVAQNGIRRQFGELFRERKTIVIFIRHFWCVCPLCQDYMSALSRTVDPEALRRADVDLVIIGNGSPAMIKSYRQIFRTPFALYTDPTLRLHAELGMTLRTTDAGPESEKGDYVRHGLVGGIAMVVRNALKVGMPVWEKGGDVAQLGGEFILGPGLSCMYAHRMSNTRAHAPISHVLAAA
ncbi:hypothetical protein OBBRIDRAFT_737671, partial [Obba rivulosa]